MLKKRLALKKELQMHKNKTKKNTFETLDDENEYNDLNSE